MSGITQGGHVPDHDSTRGCHPILFRMDDEQDFQEWGSFVSAYPGITCHDSVWSQLKELMGILRPMDKLSDEGRDERAKLYMEEKGGLATYGVWVYYPWLFTAVRVLEEEDFIRVRTNRNMYKITPKEQEILRSKKIGVIGMSVGKSIARVLTTERICGEIRIADFDLLELSNMNRIQTSLVNLGIPKTTIVAREIAEQDPFIKVVVFSKGVNKENMNSFLMDGGKLDILLDECDSLDVKIQCRLAARELGIPVIMETNDRGLIDVERFDLGRSSVVFDDQKKCKETQLSDVVDIGALSPRMTESLRLIGESIENWPQLISDTSLGAGVVGYITKSLLLRESDDMHGRHYVDLNAFFGIEKDTVIG